ncbi:MAG TPA: ECF-type sigma factor [Luteitalea sp.]|nr:ECF-type sigma factor [Luteitalea sp.]
MPDGSADNARGRADLTRLLERWSDGDGRALEALVDGVYPELHAIAAGIMRRERKGTLHATALVHDLFLQLLKKPATGRFDNRRAFFGFAAGVMRHILIDHARARRSQKRGAGAERITLNDNIPFVDADSVELLDLAAAIDELKQMDPRKAELVELCAFLGCTQGEAADVLGVSVRTAKRDFRVARAWLATRLRRPDAADESSA